MFVCLHGLLDDIISYRGAPFISHFWKCLFHILGTTTKLSMTFYPETDGQKEHVNQVLEQYLRCVLSYQQEFSYNNTLHSSIDISPFFASFGIQPRFSISLPLSSVKLTAKERVRRLKEIHQDLTLELINVCQDRQKATTNHLGLQRPTFRQVAWFGYYGAIVRPLIHVPSWIKSCGLLARPSSPLSHP